MAIIKHVGKHNSKKIAILWKEVPDDSSMALIAYTETLPRIYHDSLMSVLESPQGQNSENLADEAFRATMSDGRNLLNVMHTEGYIRKVPTNQVIVTVNSSSMVRLDELNGILRSMKEGKEAIDKMAKLDAGQGLYDPAKQPQLGREVGTPESLHPTVQETPVDLPASLQGTMSNEELAKVRLDQATKMKAEATAMLQEVTRLLKEAESLQPAAAT